MGSALGGVGLGEVGIMLSKQQLREVLLDLVATDDAFLAALHRRYAESVMHKAMQQ